MTKPISIGILFFATSLAPAIARAQEGDVQRAQALFDEGKTLFEAENFSAACPKLAESKELAPGIGVTLYLATCEETIGLRATALSDYREAETMAHARGDGREAIAHAYVTRLESQTPRIRIRVPNSGAKITVTDNGHAVSTNSTRGFPVDPGPHKIRATGTHNEEWMATVHVPQSADGVDGGTFEVNVPQLDGAIAPVAIKYEAPKSSSNGVTQKGIAIGVGALGVVGLGIGAYLGLHAKSLQDESNGAGGGCDGSDRCDPHGQDLRMSAISSATASTVLIAVGGAAVVTGVVLYVVSPSSHNDVAVALGPSNASLVGSF